MTNRIILFSYDRPERYERLLNASAGIWKWKITPGDVQVLDDNGNIGYYEYTNAVQHEIFSFSADGVYYAQTESIEDLYAVDSSWFYDSSTTTIYIHFTNYEPPLGKTLLIGIGVGFSNRTNRQKSYYNNFYYAPRVKNIQNVKKSIDPLFFGVLKYQGGKITLINDDGEFDDWRGRNLFGQATRILFGDDGDTYDQFTRVHSGYIENDSRDFNTLDITVTDVRQALTQPVARNTLSKTVYPDLSDDDVDQAKPVIYGSVKNVPTYCLNNAQTGSPDRVFLFMDTEFNQASSITVYADGVALAYPSEVTDIDYVAGTFTTTNAAQADKEITVDVATPIANGASIIKDLMYRYDGKNYLSSFWDITETDAAVIAARDTSLYIDSKDTRLIKAIESVCFDIDARFLTHDTGKYTIRLYDADRTPTRTIYADEWLTDPSIDNNGAEYLTSAIIKFNYDKGADTYQQVEYKDYEAAAFARYKKYKVETFETRLTDEAAALEKAATIMQFSSNVQDIISRSIPLQNNDLEIADFVICDPLARPPAAETRAVYEIIGLDKDLEKEQIKLTLRYVKADPNAALDYGVLSTVDGDYITTVDGNTIYTITEAV